MLGRQSKVVFQDIRGLLPLEHYTTLSTVATPTFKNHKKQIHSPKLLLPSAREKYRVKKKKKNHFHNNIRHTA